MELADSQLEALKAIRHEKVFKVDGRYQIPADARVDPDDIDWLIDAGLACLDFPVKITKAGRGLLRRIELREAGHDPDLLLGPPGHSLDRS